MNPTKIPAAESDKVASGEGIAGPHIRRRVPSIRRKMLMPMHWLYTRATTKPPLLASVMPSAIAVLKITTIARLRGRVAKSAAVGTGLHFQAAAFTRGHSLPEARARAEEEYRKAVESAGAKLP